MRMLLVFTPLLVAATGPASVDVTVTGIRSTNGALSVCVMPAKSGFPTCEKAGTGMKQRVAISGGTMRVRFNGLAVGDYAITAFHDEDGDGKLKTNFIGMPREGVAVSGRAGGIPSFSKAVIKIAPGTEARIAMRYL